jgi:hypothetical protein
VLRQSLNMPSCWSNTAQMSLIRLGAVAQPARASTTPIAVIRLKLDANIGRAITEKDKGSVVLAVKQCAPIEVAGCCECPWGAHRKHDLKNQDFCLEKQCSIKF